MAEAIISRRILNTENNENNIFIAEYNVTSFNEIINAYNEGKLVMVRVSSETGGGITSKTIEAYLSSIDYTSGDAISARFTYNNSNYSYEYSVGDDDSWSTATTFLANKDLSNINNEDFKTKADAAGLAPMYTYGTEDLVAGESELETGKLHFVYE